MLTRLRIGGGGRGKSLSPHTISLIREAALNRPPMSDETRAKVSANSAKAQLYQLSLVDGSLFSNGERTITLRTIDKVAEFCQCNERTVRRAVKGSGILRGKWSIVSLGLDNQ